jgi:hypothetical protein
VVLLATWPVARAGAQISPGPLAGAHASLEGSLKCRSCHAGGRSSLSAQCVACHKDIGWLVERHRGLHATTGEATCASCHPDHAGATFDLIKWPDGAADRFDHSRAGWALAGKHANVKCESCHTARFRVSPAAGLSVLKTYTGWTGLEQACAACHTDPHRGALGRDCQKCHGAEQWSAVTGFSHQRTRYPLTGKHATTKCDACHLDSRLGLAVDASGRPVPRFRPLAFGECSACHKDPHAGRLGPRCAACHETAGFNVLNTATFDHERTHYPLRGAHRRTACDGCHDFSGRPGAKRSPRFAACTDCHRDTHRGTATLAGKPADCSACHTLDRFTPAQLTVDQHAATRYPLTGRHAAVRCADCHRRSAVDSQVAIRPAFARCRDCHRDDPHAGPVSRDCRDCHDTRGFAPSTVDVSGHGAYFALEGAHRAVLCSDCHRELRGTWRPQTRLPLGAAKTCAGCHAGPHGTQFAGRRDQGRCDACHGTDGWRPATRFDHERDAAFSLKGGHAQVTCARCHPAARPQADRRYRPVSAKCESCHGKEVR